MGTTTNVWRLGYCMIRRAESLQRITLLFFNQYFGLNGVLTRYTYRVRPYRLDDLPVYGAIFLLFIP